MRKTFLIAAVICLCMLVAAIGTITFVRSDSVLKHEKEVTATVNGSKLKIFIDLTVNKLFLIENGTVIKYYPIASGKYSTPSPIGEWIITSKGSWGKGFGGRWMGLNVPWGTFFLEHDN